MGICKKNNKKIRVTLDLSPKAAARLNKLQELLELDTKASVIRQSLQLHEFLINEARSGKKVFIVDDKEKAVEIVILLVP
jgi:ribonucleotide monophosphatase NagD (HAD superfamily)